MSEPLGVEERARLRALHYSWCAQCEQSGCFTDDPKHYLSCTDCGEQWPCGATTLLTEVDRLTEESKRRLGIAEAADRRWLDALARAERAEAQGTKLAGGLHVWREQCERAEADLAACCAELDSTRTALAFSNESVEAMREQAKKGVGVCWNGACRQPAEAIVNDWPLCGEHGAQKWDQMVADLAELADLREAMEHVKALPKGHTDEWSPREHLGHHVMFAVLDQALRKAEADLADEKRRHGDIWDEGYRTCESDFGESGDGGDVTTPNPYRALLDTATEETP